MENVASITTFIFLTCLPILLSIGAVLKTMSVTKKNKALVTKLIQASKVLEAKEDELTSLKKRYSTVLNFQNSLHVAELSTQLQTPRTTVQATSEKSFAPEKYKYAQSLAEKGMSAEEIGSILTMSPHEATQLISLTRLAQSH